MTFESIAINLLTDRVIYCKRADEKKKQWESGLAVSESSKG